VKIQIVQIVFHWFLLVLVNIKIILELKLDKLVIEIMELKLKKWHQKRKKENSKKVMNIINAYYATADE